MEVLPPPTEANHAITLSDTALAVIIYNNDTAPVPGKRIEDLLKHFKYAKKEQHKTGVNKQILWIEYAEVYPLGYKYSQYCNLFRKYFKNTEPAFYWDYQPGEFTQIDFAGKKLS